MDEFSYGPYLWRGALGGALGLFVLVIIGIAYDWSFFTNEQNIIELAVVAVAFGLIGGVIAGIIIGFLIWRITAKFGKEPKAMVRILIGSGALLIYDVLTTVVFGQEFNLVFTLGFALLCGGTAGLLSRTNTSINHPDAYGTSALENSSSSKL